MRFRLSTWLVVCLSASTFLMLNVTEQIVEPGFWDDGSEQEAPAWNPPVRAWGWPCVHYEIRETPFSRRVHSEPLAIAINAMFALSAVAVLGLSVEWLERRRERRQASSRAS